MDARSTTTAGLIASAIDETLREFVEEPFFNIREHDYQAVLFGKLRTLFPVPIPVQFRMNPATSKGHDWKGPKTARVHRESCIGRKGKGGDAVNIDLIVFHDGVVTLQCHQDGPTALQEPVQLPDLAAAIEIKNAPSMNGGEAVKFAADVTRLARFQQTCPQLLCYAVVFDQSISLPSASSSRARATDWLARVQGLRARAVAPASPYVEVCYVIRRHSYQRGRTSAPPTSAPWTWMRSTPQTPHRVLSRRMPAARPQPWRGTLAIERR
jgi:hypothetical protein